MHGYTATANPDTSAKALGKELPISPKLAREVCGMVRGMKVDKAIKALEDARCAYVFNARIEGDLLPLPLQKQGEGEG